MKYKFYKDIGFVIAVFGFMAFAMLIGGLLYNSYQEVKEAEKVCDPYGVFAAGTDLVVCFTEDPYTLKIKRMK